MPHSQRRLEISLSKSPEDGFKRILHYVGSEKQMEKRNQILQALVLGLDGKQRRNNDLSRK